MERLGIVIQARMGSSRFPGKVLANFCGKPLLLFQIELLKKMKLNLPIVVATTTNSLDDVVAQFCINHQIEALRGNEQNVFDRYSQVARHYSFAHIIRLTSDNPLPHKQIINACLERHLASGADLTSTREVLPDRSVRRHVPMGCSVDVIKIATMFKLDSESLDSFEQEHVIPVFLNMKLHVEIVREISGFTPPPFELSVDVPDDLTRVEAYVNRLIAEGRLEEQLGL